MTDDTDTDREAELALGRFIRSQLQPMVETDELIDTLMTCTINFAAFTADTSPAQIAFYLRGQADAVEDQARPPRWAN